MRNRLIVSAVAALVLGEGALAGDFNYNYVQGSVLGTRIKANGDSDGGKGLKIEGAVTNFQPLFVYGSLSKHKYSSGSDGLKFTNATAGVGAHLSVGANMDLIGGISYESVKMSPHVQYTPRDTNTSRSGLGLMAGLRAQFGPKLEWNASLKYRDIEKIDPVIGITIGGRYSVTPALAVGVDLSRDKFDKSTLDATESVVAVGVRYQFVTGK